MQRETGYYFVKLNISVRYDFGYWTGDFWRVSGRLYDDRELQHIIETPITPEKIAAIDEILGINLDGWYPINDIKDILNKYKL